jgi:large subunit ribosomal protein L21
MYAIIEVGGRQWKVEPGTRLEVNRVSTAEGGELPVEQILFAHDGAKTHIGRPYVQGAKVICEVLGHRLGPKTISYHFRRRENWRKTVGHRQPLTQLVVKDILFPGVAASETPATTAVKARSSSTTAAKKMTAKKLED